MIDADQVNRFIENGQALQRAVDVELMAAHARQLGRAGDQLVAQAQRIESFLTFAPREDRNLAEIARSIETAHQVLQAEISRYVDKWTTKR